ALAGARPGAGRAVAGVAGSVPEGAGGRRRGEPVPDRGARRARPDGLLPPGGTARRRRPLAAEAVGGGALVRVEREQPVRGRPPARPPQRVGEARARRGAQGDEPRRRGRAPPARGAGAGTGSVARGEGGFVPGPQVVPAGRASGGRV